MPNMIQSVDSVLVVTGAGISAPSGLPVYRDSTAGWMADQRTQYISSAENYLDHLDELVPLWKDIEARARAAEPNAAHLALARWERLLASRGGWMTVVTQNVDGLHAAAGSTDVIEAHGSVLDWRTIALPGSRGEASRPDIVLFGEQPRGMERAWELAQKAELVLFVGTSGRVWPVAGLLNPANDAPGTVTMLLNDRRWESGHFDIVVLDDVLVLDRLVPREDPAALAEEAAS